MTSAVHEDAVVLLECLAGLLGCVDHLSGAALPDRRRPDVLLWDHSTRLLFVGEAKASEHPTDSAAVGRLRGYVGWLHAHHARGLRRGILGLCFGRTQDQTGWIQQALDLSAEVGLPTPTTRATHFGAYTVILMSWP